VKNRMVERDFRVGRIVIGFDQANDKWWDSDRVNPKTIRLNITKEAIFNEDSPTSVSFVLSAKALSDVRFDVIRFRPTNADPPGQAPFDMSSLRVAIDRLGMDSRLARSKAEDSAELKLNDEPNWEGSNGTREMNCESLLVPIKWTPVVNPIVLQN
jgi:hypothetical protein